MCSWAAGIISMGSIENTSLADYDAAMNINVRSSLIRQSAAKLCGILQVVWARLRTDRECSGTKDSQHDNRHIVVLFRSRRKGVSG